MRILLLSTYFGPDIASTGVLMTYLTQDLAGLGHLGVPGLVGYVALLATFAITAWRAYQPLNDRWLRALIVGLACGMLAHCPSWRRNPGLCLYEAFRAQTPRGAKLDRGPRECDLRSQMGQHKLQGGLLPAARGA